MKPDDTDSWKKKKEETVNKDMDEWKKAAASGKWWYIPLDWNFRTVPKFLTSAYTQFLKDP